MRTDSLQTESDGCVTAKNDTETTPRSTLTTEYDSRNYYHDDDGDDGDINEKDNGTESDS
ncbi:hypothetical protein H4S08_004520, partial [Coemansia sp. RSA 1365]